METSSDKPSKRGLKWRWVLFVVAGAFVLLGAAITSDTPNHRVESQNQVNSIVTALYAHRVEYGAFPEGSNAQIADAIRGNNPGKVPFFEAAPDQLNKDGELIDPWGTPYRIHTSGTEPLRVYSFGKNRRDNDGRKGSDDIVTVLKP